ncbi:CehA/McbA family metallohydrolase [Streptomyces californicus]|uniref:CehA/McbA family metallohydrolase n=1 Tax=Streptomyces californicus TaxID=67351 RepID=UPI001E61434D|nr:CehA/McbA family metallohydrolase [Streptomyces californicus]MCC0580537.1 CehA/McbA family metallohydrolase [Streptomyces californicus]
MNGDHAPRTPNPLPPATTRRGLLTGAAATGLTWATASTAHADGHPENGAGTGAGTDVPHRARTRTLRGTLPAGSPDYVYLPVDVPPGVAEFAVSYTYGRPPVPPGVQGNALDIGLFDERGTALGGRGFRGWSGGARTSFFVRADAATPGYLPGRVRPGTWHIALAPYTVAPEGLPYEVTVTLRFGESAPAPVPVHPPERAKGRGRAWYRGDCHLHSTHSDGRRTPAEVAAAARAAGLDFINSSEHNTTSAHAAWEGLWGEDLLILTGEEITTRNGHVLAVGTDPGVFVDWRYRARDQRFGRYARRVRGAGGLVVPAHPHATCIGCSWKFGFAEADAVEVWNGPWTPDDEVALAEWDNALAASVRDTGGGPGRWLPAMGNSDAHREPDRVGHPQTVVLADALSRRAILAGIRAGRSYIAESAGLALSFGATDGRGRHAGIGERLRAAADAHVTVRLEVSGAAAGCTVRLVTDQGVLLTSPLPGSGAGVVEWRTTPAHAAYVRAEVRHAPTVPGLPGAFAALTNPVFLDAGTGTES